MDMIETVDIIFSSTSSAESDSDESRAKRPRIQNFVQDVVNKYTDTEFKENFRMHRRTFNYLLNLVKEHISSSSVDVGHPTIDAKRQLLCAIWYFSTPDSYRSICTRFDIGKATGLRIGVCDYKMLFTHCYAGEVGSVHDSTVLKRSEVWDFLLNNEKFPENTHLLGDKAYHLLPTLITLYKDNGHLNNEQTF
ncbi:uncharacterized protein LOC111692021 [Anoplophora glabripennis]|uniref:uncharacterized protein LOC111692021 n=1 Tax=Anoplophora glabripennis TaxID=217634 RepID=UPI000C78F747|nr:uncharacterized protein LOC111692021 [Anoplophora glabripennis]